MEMTLNEWVLYPLGGDDHRDCWRYMYDEWSPGAFVIQEGVSFPDGDPDKSLCSWQIRSGGSFAGAQLAKSWSGEIGVENTKRIALEVLQRLRAGWGEKP